MPVTLTLKDLPFRYVRHAVALGGLLMERHPFIVKSIRVSQDRDGWFIVHFTGRFSDEFSNRLIKIATTYHEVVNW